VEVRFVADAMLGKLARWLRIMGYDTLYEREWDDAELVYRARAEGRVLLTRDTGITGEGIRILFIRSDHLREQLKQVFEELGLRFDEKAIFTRCPVCNGEIREVDKRKVENLVPEFVYYNNERFAICTNCGKIFWRGTHTNRIRRVIGEIT